MLRLLVCIPFQVCFTPLIGVLFTFPSRYLFAIGLIGVFSLTGWSRQIHTRFLVSRATWVPIRARYQVFSYRVITFFDWTFQTIHLTINFLTHRTYCSWFKTGPTTPNTQSLQAWHVYGLGSSRFARHYYGNHFYFLFLELLRCVSSLR